MIFSYKTRQFFRRALRTLVVLALILAISVVFFAVWLRGKKIVIIFDNRLAFIRRKYYITG